MSRVMLTKSEKQVLKLFFGCFTNTIAWVSWSSQGRNKAVIVQ